MAITLAILAIASFLGYEIFNLTGISLWHDEAFSGLLIRYNFGEMIYRIGLDVHPPFYYILLKIWSFLFGNALFALRLFSVLFSALTILGIYFLTKEALKNKNIAIFSSVLLALNSFQIQYAMEARMYTLGLFLIVISSFFLLKALKFQKWKWWLFYALSITAGIYTHYFVFFSVLAQAIFVIYWILRSCLRNKNLLLGLAAYALTAFLYLPWLKIFLRQLKQVEESFWIPQMNAWSIPATLFKMATGESTDPARFWWVLAIVSVLAFAAIIFSLKKISRPAKWLIFLLLIVPFLATIALSAKASIYLDRYFIFVLPFFLILIISAILSIKNSKIKNALAVILLFGALIAFPARWENLDAEKKPGMAGAVDFLNQAVKPGDKIYAGSSFVYFTLKYYNQTGIRPLLYIPFDLPHFSGTALLSAGDTLKDFNQGVRKNDIVFMLNTTGFGNYQPEVPANWIKQEEIGFLDVYDFRGWILVQKYIVN